MKDHRWALALAALAAAGSLGALPRAGEPESLKLVTTLAVDGGRETTLTALTGVRASEDEAPEVLKGAGDSLTAALNDLREESSRRACLGQTRELLVGENQELGPVLELVERHRELRLDTLLYIVRGQAGPALEASAERTGAEVGGEDPRGFTVGELLPQLARGEHVLAPALAPDGEGRLGPKGWAVLRGEEVVGYLEGDAALGASLLLGRAEGRGVSLPHGGVELIGARCWAAEGEVRCALAARVTQGEPSAEELEAWGERVISAALAPGWDCWGLDRQLAAPAPWEWETLRGIDVSGLEITVTGRLMGVG